MATLTPGRAVSKQDANSYEGVDELGDFQSRGELDDYRSMLLQKSNLEQSFLTRHFQRSGLHVLEIGSGNGRLLIALALERSIASGIGIEYALSRTAFAQHWASDLGIKRLQFIAGDAIGIMRSEPPKTEPLDLILALSNVFGFFKPADPTAPADFLRRARMRLRPAGCLILEVYELTDRRRRMLELADNRLRVWLELPPADRFAYYLSDLTFDPSHQILRHEKTFVARNGAIDAGRVDWTAYHDVSELRDLLSSAGYSNVRMYGGYHDEPFCEGESDQLIILAGGDKWQDAVSEDALSLPAARRTDGPGAWT